MIYHLSDARYLEFVNVVAWEEVDYEKHKVPANVKKLLVSWEREAALAELASTDKKLQDAKERINIDFAVNILFSCVKDEQQLLQLYEWHPGPKMTRLQLLEHCHKRFIEFAKTYVRMTSKYTEFAVYYTFVLVFRGVPLNKRRHEEFYGNMDEQWPWPRMEVDEMMREYRLGAVMAFQLRQHSPIPFMPEHAKDNLIHLLWKLCSAVHKSMTGQKENPIVAPLPIHPTKAAEPLAQSEGFVRAHDKGPKAVKWAGLSQRVSSLTVNNGDKCVRSKEDRENDKQKSIEAGKARLRALRQAEKERVAECWQRQRMVSLGYEIGQGADM